MGMSYEFNWYLVVDDKFKLQKNQNTDSIITIKKEYRVYPINMPIPLIIKNIGCIGLVVIKAFKIYNNSTKIEFKVLEEYNVKNEIAQDYYNLYLHMKNNK